MVTITKAAVTKIKEEMDHYLKAGEVLFLRLGMGIG